MCGVLFACTGSGRVEKYRPMVLEDIVGNVEAVERMTAIASQGNMPNLIFSARTFCLTFSSEEFFLLVLVHGKLNYDFLATELAFSLARNAPQGPPGCGKTTSIMCLARVLLGAFRPLRKLPSDATIIRPPSDHRLAC